MRARLGELQPFRTPETRRLAALFAVVYFAQGMWYLPNQTITIVLKERGFSAGQVAAFFSIVTVPWLIKPVYGLISDFAPLWGRRRQSYLVLSSALAGAAGLALSGRVEPTYVWLAGLFSVMGLGVAFTDVLVDALMVESGKAHGLTGAFQSVQWAAIYTASILVGELGGHLAERRSVSASFATAASFPIASLLIALLFIREAPSRGDRAAFRDTLGAIRQALATRELWIVAGFIFFFAFSPSFGPALLYYQTDVLAFTQQYIGHLSALGSLAAVVGAFAYAPLSRLLPLKRIINLAIGLSALGTLGYMGYRGPWSAIAIDGAYGAVSMITQLAFLDLAAKSCPRRVEATFFALLMSVYNGGSQGSEIVGGYLYDWLGYLPLVVISTAFTALAWLLVPFVRIDRIEERARDAASAAASA